MTTFHHARVFTGAGEHGWAGAFRIEDGRFTWVGDAARLSTAERAAAVDLGGRTVLPGLLDVHTHPAMMATLADAVPCLPPAVTSIEDLLGALRAGAGTDPDGWLVGYGYDDAKFPGRRGPTAADLDRVSATRPILIHRCDGHSAVASTAALAAAGITAGTPDPPGAAFGRHPDGRPNGVLTELAAVARVADARPAPDRRQLITRLAGLGEHFLSHGLVGVGDLLATAVPDALATFRAAAAAGPFPRTALYLGWADGAGPDGGPAELTDDDRIGPVRVAGVKLFLDGAFSNRTAWTSAPYPGSDDHGVRIAGDDTLRDAAAWCRRNRVQLAVHAMGDRALDRIVDLLGDQEPWLADLPSIRLEHATLLSPAFLARLAAVRMRFAVVTHTIFLFAEFDGYAGNLHPHQVADAYPIRSLYESGLPAALASDRPATAWADADDVFTSVRAAVTRRAYDGSDLGQAQAVTVAQALLLYTGRAAAVAPFPGLGRIRPGADGTFVVVDPDPFAVPPDELDRVRVVQTWVRGTLAYRR